VKQFITVALYIVAISLTSLAQESTLTLEQAVNVALVNNPKVQQYSMRVKQKDLADLNAWGNFLPTLSIQAGFNHLNDPLSISLDPIRQAMIALQTKNEVEFKNLYTLISTGSTLSDANKQLVAQAAKAGLEKQLPAFESQLKRQDYWKGSLRLIQPLFTGGKLIAAKDFSSSKYDESLVELQTVKNEITAEVTSYYLSVVLMQEVVKVRRDVVSGIERHVLLAEKLLAEGLISQFNVLRAKTALADAKKNLQQDSTKLSIATLALLNTMGDTSVSVKLNEGLLFFESNMNSDSLIATAKINQPAFQLLALKKEQAAIGYTSELSKFMPTIVAFGEYELFPEYLSALEPEWVVGVQAQFTLFNGFKDYHSLQIAEYVEKEVDYAELDVERKIALLVNKHYREVLSAQQNYTLCEDAILFAQENLRLNQKRFETGLGTSLELIDAQLQLEKALIDSRIALFNYYSSLNALSLTTGDHTVFYSLWNSSQGN